MPDRIEILRSIVSDNYLILKADASKEFLETPGDLYATCRCHADAKEIVEFLTANDPTLIVCGRVPAAPEKPTSVGHEYTAGILHGMLLLAFRKKWVNARKGNHTVSVDDKYVERAYKALAVRDLEEISRTVQSLFVDLEVEIPDDVITPLFP